jgi:hypothetical protein
MRTQEMVEKASATVDMSPATPEPSRPQQAMKLLKKASVSKNSVRRKNTQPKRHMYQ